MGWLWERKPKNANGNDVVLSLQDWVSNERKIKRNGDLDGVMVSIFDLMIRCA